jgi:hypothetical protein
MVELVEGLNEFEVQNSSSNKVLKKITSVNILTICHTKNKN